MRRSVRIGGVCGRRSVACTSYRSTSAAFSFSSGNNYHSTSLPVYTTSYITQNKLNTKTYKRNYAINDVNTVKPRLDATIDRFMTEHKKSSVTPKMTDHMMNDWNLDSLELTELLVWTEEEFGVTMPDKTADETFVYQDLLLYLQSSIIKPPTHRV
eukprot:TRINITY_DN3330_c0_g1_i1.p1 TRINITY_DN3330_c0_g1~~TRINITY_DN3330_c0_g1_i1.p1  ORF type:complete len:168 (-),score=17.86 TRINITY_DN3330_c0_g1_i1:50-517(-)